jgi:anti-sigma regulatory factor (Ser/Thr protein kinase)
MEIDGMAAAGGPMSVTIAVADSSAVGTVRRAALTLAGDTGLNGESSSVVALIATEAATNIVRHAREGAVHLRALSDRRSRGVEVLAVDKGPGIDDVDRAMRDGFSTAGTSGTGLGAIRRLASDFDLYTRSDVGTVLMARVRIPSGAPEYEDGVVCVPYPGEMVCGDGWLVNRTADAVSVALVDGLGHGIDAALAASEATRAIMGAIGASPADIVRAAHGPLRATRGAALAVARIDRTTSKLHFAGVGNITATIISASGARNLASHNGIVGHELRKVQEFTYDWPPNASLIMHSDGLSARWRIDAYPTLAAHSPAITAALLHRDFVRPRDDATIVVVRDAAR